MKIFITGGTGFIGSHTLKRLALTDHQLCCLTRESSDLSVLKELGVKIVTGDLADRESLLEGMQDCDWVIDIAGVYSFWEPNKRIYRDVNVTGTKNVMECALETGISKIVHVSTGGIYGKPEDYPFSEESPVGPIRFSEYFKTKYEGDLIAWEMYENKGLPLVMIYPCAVIGAGDPKTTGRYIGDLINRRMPATVLHNSVLTWVHVKDVAEAIVRAAEKEDNIGEKYLIGKHQLSIKEINNLVSDISGAPLPKLSLPNFVVSLNARLLTILANLVKKPPLWGMSVDQIRTMKMGFAVDGSKAERELGISYTPVRDALEEAIASFRE